MSGRSLKIFQLFTNTPNQISDRKLELKFKIKALFYALFLQNVMRFYCELREAFIRIREALYNYYLCKALLLVLFFSHA